MLPSEVLSQGPCSPDENSINMFTSWLTGDLHQEPLFDMWCPINVDEGSPDDYYSFMMAAGKSGSLKMLEPCKLLLLRDLVRREPGKWNSLLDSESFSQHCADPTSYSMPGQSRSGLVLLWETLNGSSTSEVQDPMGGCDGEYEVYDSVRNSWIRPGIMPSSVKLPLSLNSSQAVSIDDTLYFMRSDPEGIVSYDMSLGFGSSYNSHPLHLTDHTLAECGGRIMLGMAEGPWLLCHMGGSGNGLHVALHLSMPDCCGLKQGLWQGWSSASGDSKLPHYGYLPPAPEDTILGLPRLLLRVTTCTWVDATSFWHRCQGAVKRKVAQGNSLFRVLPA
ncbi:Galactose oxidase/kelch repeat superfamily protein [Prunus dulcis]|uniref:Galactose oxidase/kelch repeat superfamily protein n=1 Tax=Prunus dulcis TaxID=3755 RepID=A0A4Y1S1H4_PRUDU|nr:Galactose oxidase/kelch repeat superfamily protein [Prunus dulcis]